MNKFLLICTLLIANSYVSEAIFDGGLISIPIIAGIIGLKIAGGIGFGAGVLASRGGRRGRFGGRGRRFGRSVTESEVGDAFLQASIDDADDCAKKMVCMVNSKSVEELSEIEKTIHEMFGQDDEINVSKSTVEFDLAALVGRKAGYLQCKSVYARCPHSQEVLVQVFGA